MLISNKIHYFRNFSLQSYIFYIHFLYQFYTFAKNFTNGNHLHIINRRWLSYG